MTQLMDNYDKAMRDLSDPVVRPEHYCKGEIECIDAIQSALTPTEYLGYLRGNVIKYLWRWPYKGGVEDLNKAKWYLNRLTEAVEDRPKKLSEWVQKRKQNDDRFEDDGR